ncbi:MAG: HAMP domain-containing sensor histidine kinase [Burkholderiaceae bacterium]
MFLPATLHEGLQSLKAADVGWRVMVARNAGGQRFGVAQLQWVRDEVVRDSSVEALVPVLVLVPLLLLIVNLLLRQGFAPLVKLSGEIDRDDGQLRQLESHGIPSEVLPLVQAVNRLLMRLDGTLAQQQRMVANAAHEMRTPVAAARVQADNLAHAELPVEARARLESLQLGLARLSELVEQLLGFARVQSSAPVVDQLVALDELISAAVEETLVFAESRQIDLGCIRLDHARVRGDPSRAYALIRNAIDNAVRYTPAGGRVDLNLMADGGEAVFAIEDTGPGIPAELREQAFEPFFRIVGSRQSGSGLGLAIVRSAAQALGGGVELTERLDGKAGLRFVYRQRLASGVVHRPLGSPNP